MREKDLMMILSVLPKGQVIGTPDPEDIDD